MGHLGSHLGPEKYLKIGIFPNKRDKMLDFADDKLK
jgi:hypothetical protein